MLFHLQSLVSTQKDGKVIMYDGNVKTDERDGCLMFVGPCIIVITEE